MTNIDTLLDVSLPAELKSAQVKGLQDDSRKVTHGDLFFAIPGSHANGNAFARTALEKGAVAVVSQEPAPDELEPRWIQVNDVIQTRLDAACRYYGNPMEHLECHGVTGTNGKTTTAFLMHAVLTAAGRKTALLGTICQRIGNQEIPSSLTTPGLLELHDFAAQAVAAGCTDLVMEVSSHSLHQNRIAGMYFRSALFSNLTQDHLDYHKTMDAYYHAKELLFTRYLQPDGTAILNVDDAYGMQLYNRIFSTHEALAVSRQGNPLAPNYVEKIEYTEDGLKLSLPVMGEKLFNTHLCGEFNADNILLVAGWTFALCLPVKALRSALESVQVPGRFEMVYNDGNRRVIVDYAHTPDALERVLKTARTLCRGKLHVVFGCGGDRDKGKRPLMGQIALRNADRIWVTSDNPRTEDPEQIIQDIVAGMDPSRYTQITDRSACIHQAAAELKSGDWLIVAGKGHETYQILGTQKVHFDDHEVIREAMLKC